MRIMLEEYEEKVKATKAMSLLKSSMVVVLPFSPSTI
jgi:hypothetical protein